MFWSITLSFVEGSLVSPDHFSHEAAFKAPGWGRDVDSFVELEVFGFYGEVGFAVLTLSDHLSVHLHFLCDRR